MTDGAPGAESPASAACFAWATPERVTDDIDAELRSHFEERKRDLVAQGMGPEAAALP